MDINLKVWDPKTESNLSSWLRQQKVAGLICSDNGSQYQRALDHEKIWVIWKQEGEVAEIVERWANGEFGDPASFKSLNQRNLRGTEQNEALGGENFGLKLVNERTF